MSMSSVPRVTVIVGGMVLKLQLFCVSSEHRQNDEKMRGQERRLWELEKDSWQRGCMATVTDLGNSQNTEVFCTFKGQVLQIC